MIIKIFDTIIYIDNVLINKLFTKLIYLKKTLYQF